MKMLTRRKKPEDSRYGTMIRFIDAVQSLVMLQYDKELLLPQREGDYMSIEYNPKVIAKMLEIMKELRTFDVTTIGDLYLTTGGRIVLDKGCGEYFTKGDRKIYTLKELTTGIQFKDFKDKINSQK